MKKLLALALVLVLALGTLSGCEKITEKLPEGVQNAIGTVKDKFTNLKDKIFGKDDEVDGETSIEKAGLYIFDDFKRIPEKTTENFDLLKQVKIGEETFSVTWTVDNAAVKIEEKNETSLTVVLPVKPEADVEFTLTATITDANGNTLVKTFKRTVPAYVAPTTVPSVVGKPEVGVAYKLYVLQSKVDKHLYFNGKMSGYYLSTSTDYNDGVDVFVSQGSTADTYKIYYMDGETKMWLRFRERDDKPGSGTVSLETTEPAEEYTWNETYGTLIYTNGTKSFFLNSNGTFETIGVSNTSYISGENAGNLGTSNFPAQFALMVDVSSVTDADKAKTEANNLKLPTTIDVDSNIELPGAKTYENVNITWASDNACAVVNGDGTVTFTLQSTAQTVKITATITCGTATETKVFTIEVAKKSTLVPQIVNTPVVGENYKLYLYWKTKDMPYYFNGQADGTKYLKTTNVAEEAVDVYLKAVTGGYHLCFMDGTTEKYIEVYERDGDNVGKAYVKIVDAAPASFYTYNEAARTLVYTNTATGNAFFFGTYSKSSYDTWSPSPVSYLEDASAIDETQYPAHFAKLIDTSSPSVTDADKIKAEADALTLVESIDMDKTITLPTVSVYNDVKIIWTSDNACAVVNADGTVTFTLQTTAQTVKITATLTCGSATDTKVFTIEVDEKFVLEPKVINKPVVGENYKLYLYWKTKDMPYYFNGQADGTKYLKTTNLAKEAVDVYLKEVEGGYHLCFMDGTTEKYIEVYERDGNNVGKAYVKIVDAAPASFYTYNEAARTLVYTNTATGNAFFFGTYSKSSHDTWSPSPVSYLEDASAIDETQYPAHFAKLIDPSAPITDAEKVKAEVDALTIIENISENTTITLPVASLYSDVTITWASDNACAVVNADGTVTFTLQPTLQTVKITATLTCGDATDTKIFTVTVNPPSDTEKIASEKNDLKVTKTEYNKNETTVTLPTVSKYDDVTITWSSDNAKVVVNADGTITVTLNDVAEKAVLTATLTCGDATDTKTFELSLGKKIYYTVNKVDAPVPGTAYKFYLEQENLDKTLFINGAMSGYYFDTSTSPAEATDVYVEEAADGKYYLYILEGETKKYINIYKNGTYTNLQYVDIEKNTDVTLNPYTFNAEHGVFVCTLTDGDYILGTSKTFKTFSANKFDYISTTFVGYFATISCEHHYEDACSEVCSDCGAKLNATHNFGRCSSTTCKGCGATRTASVCVNEDTDNICDKCGYEMNGVDDTPVVDTDAAPTVSLTIDNGVCALGTTINITATVADDKTAVENLTKTYSVTRAGTIVEVTGDSFVADAAGLYFIKVTVTDEAGNTTEQTVDLIAVDGLAHAGTEQDPFDVSDALKIAGVLANNEQTISKYYFTGVVSAVNTKTNRVDITIATGDDSILCYGLSTSEGVVFNSSNTEGLPQKNDTIVILSAVKNFTGTWEGATTTLETVDNILVSLVKGEATGTAITQDMIATKTTTIAENGSYVIGAVDTDGNVYIMGNSSADNQKIASVKISADTNAYVEDSVWTITVLDNGNLAIKNGNSYLTYSSGTNIALKDTSYEWVLKDGELIAGTSDTRGLALQISSLNFGGYSTSNNTATNTQYVFDLFFIKIA